MKYIITRFIDDGYGKVHRVTDFHTEDASLVNTVISDWEANSNFTDALESIKVCQSLSLVDTGSFNSGGYGNDVDKLEIYSEVDGLIKTIV